jgi:hypothetical protein
MTVRIVALTSEEAGGARVGGTAAERIALVGQLSRRMWDKRATGRDRDRVDVNGLEGTG